MSLKPDNKHKTVHIYGIILIFVVALWIRIAYIQQTVINRPIVADARQYVIYGYNLAFNKTFSQEYPSDHPTPDSFRSPGYPLLIASVLKLTDNFYPVILNIQVVLSSVLVLLTYALSCSFLPIWASYTSAILVAISPHLVSISSYLLTETLFSFMMLSSLFCFYHAQRLNNLSLYLCSSILFGYTYLTNEIVLFLPFLFSIFWLYRLRPLHKSIILKIGVFLVIFSVFPAIWMIRQANLPPNALKASQRALSTLTHGTYPDFIYKSPQFKYFPYHEDPMQPEISQSWNRFVEIFLQRFKERPLRYIRWYLIEKPYYLWSWNILQGQGDVYIYPVTTSLYTKSNLANATRTMMKLVHPIILIVAFLGILLVCYRYRYYFKHMDSVPLMLWITIVYITIVYTIFAPWPRYSIPFRPELYVWTLWVIVTISNYVYRKVKPIHGTE